MTISIYDYELPYGTHKLYDVIISHDRIHTLVTRSAPKVASWFSEIYPILKHNPIVGLDVEWRPHQSRFHENPVAILQLCVGHRCLIYQLLYTELIPQSLFNFLASDRYKFVGAGIENDVEKLRLQYGFRVTNAIDLRAWAATKFNRRDLRDVGLKALARELLGMEFEKPLNVTLSRWDNEWLSCDQVQYACVDAFVSSKIGRYLKACAT